MWFIVKTEYSKESETADMLRGMKGINEVYFPIYRKRLNVSGKEIYKFKPTISGILFINVADRLALKNIIDPKGYFHSAIKAYDSESDSIIDKDIITPAHLYHSFNGYISLDSIISKAYVSEGDLERFRFYNEKLCDNLENLKIIDLSYQTLETDNDTVMITEGPYIGFQGIVKQIKNKGRKDRNLLFRIGNWCVCLPNIRKYRHIVVREAINGLKARTVSAWTNTDYLIGRLQAYGFIDNAAETLRIMLTKLNDGNLHNLHNAISPDNILLRSFVSNMDNIDEGCLFSLSRYFQSTGKSMVQGLGSMIPDIFLRPFLTPTPGLQMCDNTTHTILNHGKFIEIVVRMDLSYLFRIDGKDNSGKYEPIELEYSNCNDENARKIMVKADKNEYIYYAHVALSTCGENSVRASVNWGGFISKYLYLTDTDRHSFLNQLDSHHYPKTLSLMTDSGNHKITPTDNALGGCYEKTFGFQIIIPDVSIEPANPMGQTHIAEAVNTLTNTCAQAAVEIWQGTRMLPWRQLLQRYVLLHRMPVN